SPNGHLAKARRQSEAALQSEKLCSSWSDDPMPMNNAVGQLVPWQRKIAIPQRPRPQDGISRLDLPIEPRERPIEARIREHIRNKQPSVRAAVQIGDDLIEVDGELALDAALDMPLEQEHETQRCERQCRNDRERPGKE